MNRILLLLTIVFTFVQNAVSAGPVSADATYRHLKNLEYEVTIVAYRDCRSIPWNVYNLYIYNDSFSLYTAPTRIKIEDIAYYCKTKPCSPQNTTTGNAGLEAHYFVDTIDFNTGVFKKFVSKNYCNVSFALSTCCRNGSILTTSNGNMFVESMLNLCLAKKTPVQSPKFVNSVAYYAACNQTLSYSFYCNNVVTGDSVSYELVTPKDGANYYQSYTGGYSDSIPMTPYCTPPGVLNCTPSIINNPVRGMTFNSTNGNLIFTPINCTEIGVIVCQVNVFRKDSGKYKLAGYSKRDMMVVVNKPAINKPSLATYRNYTIKARENYCMDIKVKDDTTKTNKDTVKLIVREFPKYGKLTLLDSNAREKTLHFCWNVSDSDYIKLKEANIAIYAYDKPCTLGQDMSTVINFKVVAPDSLTNILIRTFYDINKNGWKDAGEPYRSAPVLSQNNQNPSHLQTDINGLLSMKPLYAPFTFNINRNQFVYATSKDTLLYAKFDSTHVVTIGFNYYQGIRGKVFEDVNNNCVFDLATDKPIKDLKIVAKNSNAVAFTDINGDYLLNNILGNYQLAIDPASQYYSTCYPIQNTLIVKDSQFNNYNFPLIKKSGFPDVSVVLKTQTHHRNNGAMTQLITVENKGNIKAKNFYIKMLTSKKLFQFGSTPTASSYRDTFYWLIDSIASGATKTISFNHTLMTDSFVNGDQISYQLWAYMKDSVQSNNYYEITETINDYPCCKTEKVVYVPEKYYPKNNDITYRLSFVPATNSKRALIQDELDTVRFDLRTLRILNNSNNPTVSLKHNILNIDYTLSTFITNIEFVYSIALKAPVTDSFTVLNSAKCIFDNQATQKTNTTSSKIVSPILYDSFKQTIFCALETLSFGFRTTYQPEVDNHFKVYISDSVGKFSQQGLLIDQTSYAKNNLINIQLPKVYNQNTYSLKVIGTNPPVEAFSYVKLPEITINPLPTIDFTTNLRNGKICEGDNLHLTASATNYYKFHKYGSSSDTFSKDSSYYEKMKSNANYEISFKSNDGCISTSPVINVDLFIQPIVSLSASKNKLCSGETLSLQFNGASSYVLYKNNDTIIKTGIKTSPYQFIPPVNVNQYSLLGIDINGCRDTSNTVNILVLPLPQKPIISRIDKALKSSYASGNQWYNLSGKIDTATNQYYYPPVDGQYFIKYTDNNSCESTSNLYDVNYTSIVSFMDEKSFVIYPNPASKVITIENVNFNDYSIYLYDAYGRLVLNESSLEKTNVINIERLSAGNYILKIKSGGQLLNYKVMILK